MAVKYSNDSSSVLSAGITDSATSFDVSDGSAFPTLGANDHMYLTIVGASVLEIIRVTDITSNTITCTRGEDGTTATAASMGDAVELRLCTALLQDIVNEVADETFALAIGL